jgi:hypothetical protein
MRMIVEAFKETLELGLEKPKQVVVRFFFLFFSLLSTHPLGNDPRFRPAGSCPFALASLP